MLGRSVDQRQGLYSYVHGTWITIRMRMHTRRALFSNADALENKALYHLGVIGFLFHTGKEKPSYEGCGLSFIIILPESALYSLVIYYATRKCRF